MTQPSPTGAPQRFAFYDLDGTLLPWDTQMLFCHRILKRQGWRRILLLPFFLTAPLAVPRILRSRTLKRIFLCYLWRMPRATLENEARAFAREVAQSHVWPEMRRELERHRTAGRTLVINTASPDFYATAIARELGFDHCFATRVPIGDRVPFLPPIDGPNNKRSAKIDAMRNTGLIAADTPLPLADSWTYTDSIVDLPLLACAAHGALVHPKPKLAQHPAAAHAETRLPTPHPSPLHRLTTTLLLILGLGPAPTLPHPDPNTPEPTADGDNKPQDATPSQDHKS